MYSVYVYDVYAWCVCECVCVCVDVCAYDVCMYGVCVGTWAMACVWGAGAGADLSGVNLGLVEEGLLGEVDEVVLGVLPLHYGTAVGGWELTLLFVSSGHQLGVLELQSGGDTVTQC